MKIFILALTMIGTAALADTSSVLYQVNQKKGSYYTYRWATLLGASSKINYAVNKSIADTLGLSQAPCNTAQGSSWNVDVNSILMLPDLVFSIKTLSGGYCADAVHPSAESLGMVFDLSNGKQVSLNDQLKGGTTNILDTILLKKAQTDADYSDDCKQAIKSQDISITAASFYIVNQGTIHIMTDMPHMAQACDVETDVSLDSIKSSIAPNSLLDKLLKPNP